MLMGSSSTIMILPAWGMATLKTDPLFTAYDGTVARTCVALDIVTSLQTTFVHPSKLLLRILPGPPTRSRSDRPVEAIRQCSVRLIRYHFPQRAFPGARPAR